MPLVNQDEPAPAFELKDQVGKSRALKDFRGRVLVLYFYPKDDSSACTTQACQFRDHHPDFSKIKAALVAVGPGSADSHNRFAQRHALDFPLLVDEADSQGRPAVAHRYGAWASKSMYGRTFMGVTRTTYLIDADGIVQRRWDRVRLRGHVAEVLAATRDLLGVGAGSHHHARGATAKVRKGAADSQPPFAPVRGPTGPRPRTKRAVRGRATTTRGPERKGSSATSRGRNPGRRGRSP